MTFYDFTSSILTVVGYSVLVYRIIFELEDAKTKKSRLEKLCTKWLIFTIFLKIQFYILAIIEIIPFGAMILLIFKLFLFLPENAISHEIYKRIQKHLDKVRLQEYNSHFGIALSFICTNTVAILMKFIIKMAAFIDSKHIEEVERHILDIIKVLEYKKAAINTRHQTMASDVNKDLNASEFNYSVDEEPRERELQVRTPMKSNIGNQMSKILTEVEGEDSSEQLKLKGQVMIIKPNKATGQKAKYQQVQVEYYLKTSKINLTNKHQATEAKTLKEVRWITKNMMNIELVFEEGGSKILKIRNQGDVAKWIQPVCLNLQTIKEQPI